MRRAGSALQELDVATDDEQPLSVAINYPRLAGACRAGDRVLLNTTAVELGLGTGGTHFVVARLGDGIGVALDSPSGGHVMKLRYTPLQTDVVSVESPESPSHDLMRTADDLGALPVVCCGLHSQVPLVAAAIKGVDPGCRVVYCMTDDASLPLQLSSIVGASMTAGLIDATVSCGQAFGGGFEAVNLHSGLLAARHVAEAGVAIVAIGPGVVGTSTAFGHGGVSQGEAINAVASLGGTPIPVLRLSFADTRERHRVVSHHTLCALTRVALAPALIAVPALPAPQAEQVEASLERAGVWTRHRRAPAAPAPLTPDLRGVEVTTMGRGFDDDPAFFAASFAAGAAA
ncbi:MAG: DUF3866 family protein, partial [Acidimicrobiales bacterium]|nr:DUF3866 family protein [Acidimicrobiales bacterium]